ncbi:MAG TPA: hypothetical protein VH134_17610 [Candidatus Dormibacteraeota bacterium]|jgi:hypothetical protein|nr:hypothetical protein [Candidatus Dormibacteraeota bacterium]
MTPRRVLLGVLLALVVIVAVAGPGHVWSLVIIIGGAFVVVVGLGVVRGIRDGFNATRAEDGTGDEPGETPSGL